MFTAEETLACEKLIALALAEDLGDRGDVTSQAVIPWDLQGSAVFLVKAPGVLAGLPAAELVMRTIDTRVRFETFKKDGDRVVAGDRVAKVTGPMLAILSAERTALNFLQHLSGIASLTHRNVDAVAGLPVKVLDTRKTLPGWRLLEKYAVRQGGGQNHRMGLHDGILIKDNHLAALPMSQTIEETVRLARTRFPDLPIEVEVDSVAQAGVALACRPAIVLLDNMRPEQLREVVRSRNQLAANVLLEASGGITFDTIRAVAETGVDRISVGALTHSAPALDIALDYSP